MYAISFIRVIFWKPGRRRVDESYLGCCRKDSVLSPSVTNSCGIIYNSFFPVFLFSFCITVQAPVFSVVLCESGSCMLTKESNFLVWTLYLQSWFKYSFNFSFVPHFDYSFCLSPSPLWPDCSYRSFLVPRTHKSQFHSVPSLISWKWSWRFLLIIPLTNFLYVIQILFMEVLVNLVSGKIYFCTEMLF